MKKFISKATVGLATVGLIGSLIAPAALADNTISGNGALSTNTINSVGVSKCAVYQNSSTVAITNASSTANSGQNQANWNTGGNVSVTSGDATATVGVTVTGGANVAIDPCCGCDGQLAPSGDNEISGNGFKSNNDVNEVVVNVKKVKQKSKTWALTSAKAKAKTGKNKANGNTDGTTTVESGVSTAETTVDVAGGGNTL